MVSFPVRRIYGAVGFLVLSLAAIPAFGELSQPLKEWGSGPAQWIMTPDEQRAWRKITSDTEANNFIDLFWVRRDPSRGTAANEFHDEFDNRVAFSDKTFKEKKKRGAPYIDDILKAPRYGDAASEKQYRFLYVLAKTTAYGSAA